MNATPPLLAERALAFIVGDPDWRDAILGDLREEFVSMTRRHGLPSARRWYWAQAINVAAHRAVSRVRGPGKRRTREMGVRMALGATRSDVVRLSCLQALRLTAAGIGVGLVLSFFVARGLESAMFGVVTGDATLVAVLASALATTALAAGYVPARGVSRTDPTVALRSE